MPECSTRKSSARRPVSKLISPESPWNLPCAAKQYSQLRLHVCATCRHSAFTTVLRFLKSNARFSYTSGANSLPDALSASTLSRQSATSCGVTSGLSAYFSSMAAVISSGVCSSYMPMTSYASSSTTWTLPLYTSSTML